MDRKCLCFSMWSGFESLLWKCLLSAWTRLNWAVLTGRTGAVLAVCSVPGWRPSLWALYSEQTDHLLRCTLVHQQPVAVSLSWRVHFYTWTPRHHRRSPWCLLLIWGFVGTKPTGQSTAPLRLVRPHTRLHSTHRSHNLASLVLNGLSLSKKQGPSKQTESDDFIY